MSSHRLPFGFFPQARGREILGAADNNAGVGVELVHVIVDRFIKYGLAAFAIGGGGVHEVGTTLVAHDQADMGGVLVWRGGSDGADVAIGKVTLSVENVCFGDVIDGELGHAFFDLAHGRDE